MSLSINYNASAVRAQFSLSSVDRQIGSTLERLSSGVRLLRTADDPASMTIANQLRHNLSGVLQAVENVEESVALIRTGESAMDEISGLLNRMRSLALGAANDGANNQTQLNAYQQELEESIFSINNIANNTSFGSIKLLNGNLADSMLSNDARAFYKNLSHDAQTLINGVKPGSSITINPPSANLSRSSVDVSFFGTPTQDTSLSGLTQVGTGSPLNVAGDTITITGANGTANINLNANTTIRQLVGQINAQSQNIGAFASYDEATGALRVESLNFGGGGIDISSTDVNATGVGLLDSVPNNIANSFMTNAGNATIAIDYIDENDVAQTAILVQDTSKAGGLLFSGDGFSLTARDTSSGGMGATIVTSSTALTGTRKSSTAVQIGALSNQRTQLEMRDMRAGALGHGGIGNASGYESLQDLLSGKALMTGNAQDALRIIDAAISEVSSERGKLGALESASLERTLGSLRVSSEILTESESLLRDADFAYESAEFARQNIIYQAATAMLAQANQLPQSVLQLLS